MWLALTLAAAQAHRPHAVVATAAIPEQGAAWLVVDREARSALLRSDDGGAHWDYSGGPPTADELVDTAAWDGGVALLAGTWEGAWWSDDRGEGWARVPRHARYEAGSVHLRCQTPGGGDCEVYQDPDQGGGGGWVLQPRDRVRFTFPGYAFRVVGVGGLPPGAEIDGRALALKESGASGNLEQGWHDVELVAGERFHLDRIEVFGEGEPLLPQTRLASIGGCGCASGRAGGSAGGALALAALLAGLVRRRRR